MRILLDECVDESLAPHLEGYDVTTVRQAGWSGRKNGELLQLAREKFDVFLTVDRNLEFQQSLENLPFAIVIVSVPSNVIEELLVCLPKLRYVLAKAKPGQVVRVES